MEAASKMAHTKLHHANMCLSAVSVKPLLPPCQRIGTSCLNLLSCPEGLTWPHGRCVPSRQGAPPQVRRLTLGAHPIPRPAEDSGRVFRAAAIRRFGADARIVPPVVSGVSSMSPRFTKRESALTPRRKKVRRKHNEFGISAAAYPDGRIAVLLARYPDLSHADFHEVLAFVRQAGPVQLRRLRSSELVRRKLDRFITEQADTLGTRREAFRWTAFAVFALLLLCWMLWDKRPQPLSAPRDVGAAQARSTAISAPPSRDNGGLIDAARTELARHLSTAGRRET